MKENTVKIADTKRFRAFGGNQKFVSEKMFRNQKI